MQLVVDALSQKTANEIMVIVKTNIPHVNTFTMYVGNTYCLVVDYNPMQLTKHESMVLEHVRLSMRLQMQ